VLDGMLRGDVSRLSIPFGDNMRFRCQPVDGVWM
jgi:hypothetical protein